MTTTTAATLAIHGGAGTFGRDDYSEERAGQYREGLRRALRAGQRVLASGGRALDAVTEAVMALEDDPLFNAGRGAVYTEAGRQEMDAAVMVGQDRRAGAVAGVFGPRNPVLAARAVMERSPHVLLIGAGAEAFARAADVAWAEPGWFETERRREALRIELARRAIPDAGPASEAVRHGTVGAVALDRDGHLAAATSTGGMTAKATGRVGDCPVIGAGTWAEHWGDDAGGCAVSCTGHGEIFIRMGAAHEVAARMRLAGQGIGQAAADVVRELGAIGGSGGLIAIDRAGRVALPFNCEGMYRGVVVGDGVPIVAIHEEALV